MTTSAHTIFQPDAGASIAWDQARAQLARSRTAQPSLEHVREELAVRELIARYAYIWDQGDIDGVLTFFTDDCVITGPYGTLSGPAEIRAHYEKSLRDKPRRRHLFCNVIVRISDDLNEGWLTAYHYAILEPARIFTGLVSDNVVKRDGAWMIRARSVGEDTMANLVTRT